MGGRFTIARDKNEYRLQPGDVMLILPDQPADLVYDNVDTFVARLPRALLEEVAHAQTGISGTDLRFNSSRPISTALGRHWTKTVSHLTRSVLPDPALMANPLVAGTTRHLLAATALAVFPNTAHNVTLRPAGGVTPQPLRRAVSYIHDHADQPITVDQVAAAAGVGARALQLAFRRHHDTTPMRYVRQVRLQRAHRDLETADPTAGATVAMIATRWGFTHLGRFSTDYRAAYGCSPSHTLRT